MSAAPPPGMPSRQDWVPASRRLPVVDDEAPEPCDTCAEVGAPDCNRFYGEHYCSGPDWRDT